MTNNQVIEDLLKRKGFKLTSVRKALIGLFLQKNSPLSVSEIMSRLNQRNLIPNKTTVYRQLEFMKKQNIILELSLGENKKRYESAFSDHHHHLICIKCETMKDIEVSKELEQEERYIEQNKQFKVLNHSLEFFGLCSKCQ